MRQTTVKSIIGVSQRDFFGIHDITSKDIAGAFANLVKLPYQQIDEKYSPLSRARLRLMNEEKDEKEVFGRVRYDSDNVAHKHGQFDENTKEPLYDTIRIKQMFVPDDGKVNIKSPGDVPQLDRETTIDNAPVQIGNPAYKISEVEPIKALGEVLQLFANPNDRVRSALRYSRKPPLTFYFENSPRLNEETPISMKEKQFMAHRDGQDEHRSQSGISEETSGKEPEILVERPHIKYDELLKPELSEHTLELNSDKFDRSLDLRYDITSDVSKKPMKASDYLEKVRNQEIEPSANKLKKRLETAEQPYPLRPNIKLDSQGFRNYTHQVPNWSLLRRVDLLDHIRASIVYNNYDIIALNKPYGIASHENSRHNELYDINNLMGEVAKSMRIDKVYLAHRLDKTTTGILLFATSKERADTLNKLFRSDEIKKTYWCITRGVPEPREGIVDMPIGEIKVAGKLRSCPAPESLEESKQLAKKFREARRAISEYRVINSTSHAALVEVKPRSGVKHQIRCHLGFGLNTPILGDHKYSHLTKLAPQNLPLKMLTALHIRQAKVRTLPMHLHAKSIVIPGAKANGETLFIHAPLPQHFIDNMKSLKLSRGLQID